MSAGGMGVVYRAEHALIGKAAAVKVLLPELSANQEIVARFFNEAKAATAIRHPGIVEIFDFGYMDTGMAYIVMEFLDGEPLSRRLAQRGKLDEREALAMIRGSASALAAAHGKGIIHRDLKPDNIFLVPDPDMPGGERPKLLDFGIAKLTDNQNGAGEASARTRTGAVMGTPTYMSPEQCRGAGEVDARSDIYSLGCILYEMLCGRPPFDAEGVGEIIGAHLFMPPDSPTKYNPGLSDATTGLVMNLLAKKPEERIQSAAELARLLGQGSLPPLVNQPHFTPTMALPSSPGQLANGTVPASPGADMGGPMTMPLPGTTLSGAASEVSTGHPTSPPTGKRSRGPLLAAFGAVAVVAVIAVVALSGGGGGSDADDTTPTAASQPATVPATTADAGAASATAPVVPDAAVEVAAQPPDAAPAPTTAAAKSTDDSKRKPRRKPRTKPKTKPDKPKPTTGPVPIETEL